MYEMQKETREFKLQPDVLLAVLQQFEFCLSRAGTSLCLARVGTPLSCLVIFRLWRRWKIVSKIVFDFSFSISRIVQPWKKGRNKSKMKDSNSRSVISDDDCYIAKSSENNERAGMSKGFRISRTCDRKINASTLRLPRVCELRLCIYVICLTRLPFHALISCPINCPDYNLLCGYKF